MESRSFRMERSVFIYSAIGFVRSIKAASVIRLPSWSWSKKLVQVQVFKHDVWAFEILLAVPFSGDGLVDGVHEVHANRAVIVKAGILEHFAINRSVLHNV